MKLLSLLVGICCSISIAVAQDAHFSQPLMSPLYLNPAMTGHMQAVHRLSLQTRGQWWTVADREYYKTISVSYDRRFCGQKNHYAFGLQLLGNEAWNNPLSNYQIQFSGAFHFNLGKKVLAIGGQIGLLQYRLKDDKLNFEDQFDPTTSTFSGNNSLESFARNSSSAGDGNVGLLFYSTKARHNFTLGMAIHHFNQPVFNFLDETTYSVEPLPMKWTLHSSISIFIKRQGTGLFFNPTAMIQRQGQQWNGLFGLMPSIGFSPENLQGKTIYKKTVALGAFVRLAAHATTVTTPDAIIVQSTYSFGGFRLAFAYDFNISVLRAASGSTGGLEVGLMYQFGSENNCTYCPFF